MLEHQKPWGPLSVDELAQIFAKASFPWWIAGGYAIEFAVGETIRRHADIDVLVLRRDRGLVRKLLAQWDCWVADPPGVLRAWPNEQELKSRVHDVWCRSTPQDDWRFQLMLDEADSAHWVSRRDSRVRAPIQDITKVAETGVRYLAPHIQLYYKAKDPRDKDQVDFDAVMDSGIHIDAPWLRKAIECAYGSQHPWLDRLPK